jgi:ActR/RegA family two-component response regulator
MKDTIHKTRKIMVTGYQSMQTLIVALNKNADKYLVEPVEIKIFSIH